MQSVLTPAFKGMTIINDHIPYKVYFISNNIYFIDFNIGSKKSRIN